jgi:DeoR family glycerol-3-phosphate regulon repressor
LSAALVNTIEPPKSHENEHTKTISHFATLSLFDFVRIPDMIQRMLSKGNPSAPASRAAAKPNGETARLPAQVRQARLVEAVRERGFISVAGVAAELGVSEMTIRRDLDELGREGQLVRTHGGALAPEGVGDYAIDREEPAFAARLRQNWHAKERIAAFAATLIDGRQTVALDVGTTTFLLAQRVAERADLKLFTSSLRIASLVGAGACEVYVPGGQIRGDEMSICGPTAVGQFEQLWFDIAFIGVSGISSAGIFDYSFDDSELKRVYLRRASRKVVLCDGSKFHRMSLVQVSGFDDIDLVVTDVAPPTDIADALVSAGVAVHVVSNPGIPLP